MSVSDAIWLFRRRVVATSLREGGNVAARRFGVHRSTVWRRAALAYGDDGLRVRERRPPRMPNAYDFLTERRIVAVALAWPTRGCDFFAGVLAQQGHRVSRSGIQTCLRRKGLAHKAERLALLEAQQLLNHGFVTERSQGLVDRAAKRIRAGRPGELVCRCLPISWAAQPRSASLEIDAALREISLRGRQHRLQRSHDALSGPAVAERIRPRAQIWGTS